MGELIAGIVIGAVLAGVFLRREEALRALLSLGRIKALLAKGAGAAPAADAEQPLALRLHKLEAEFSPTYEDASHAREFLDDANFQEMTRLLAAAGLPLKTVTQYANGGNWALSCAALAALAQRADRAEALEQVLAGFDRQGAFEMHYAFNYFLTLPQRPPAGAPFVNAKDWWQNTYSINEVAREYFDEIAIWGDKPTFGPALDAVPPGNLSALRGFLEHLNHAMAKPLIAEVAAKQSAVVDRAFLSSFGRFWTADGEKLDLLIEPEDWVDQLADAETAVTGSPFRPLLMTGETRVGKTSFLKLLGKRLEAKGWTVFEAGGADLMADQQYFGQLEGRIRRAVEELAASKKLIWYIPDILQIALSGTHQGQAASVLDQILPAIRTGRLIVWAEASASGAARLQRLRPQLRNIFEVIQFDPLSNEDTLTVANQLAARVSAESKLLLDPACAETALGAARQYLSGASLPGSALDLLKSAMARAIKDGTRVVTPASIIASLSQVTGVPAAILDNKERADLAAIRKYFGARVMGQDEAVSTIVDRIAMLKAGLNDPGKPIGVFLFAGPTGTGKTELAKTLAEFLFGSPDRLIRLDMSEYQSHDSTWKILGTADPATQVDSLIGRVRKQPFSVVLLDEFEKAHANVWDLFLQVFDDARLTDAGGQEADFRHCIIILTTNLGATSHRGADLGFLPSVASFSDDQVERAVSETFRPEFQNRLDKVIVFQPLTRELMRSILKKELSQVLGRRGFKDREWAVEWEASALEFLLEKGFSPDMGARPLKRAIDQYLIAPLAATIVERRFPEGDQFLFIRSDGKAIQAEFVDPDRDAGESAPAEAAPVAGERVPLAAMILSASGTAAEVRTLEEELAVIRTALSSEAWEELKIQHAARMQEPEFWTRPERFDLLSRIALMDRVRAAAATADSLGARLAKAPARGGKSSKELTGRLALQLHLTGEGIKDVFEGAPIEAALAVETALDGGAESPEAPVWCRQLLDMYRSWARARNMQVSEARGTGHEGAVLLVSGFGAYRALAGETGLHVLETPEAGKQAARVSARVRVAPAPLGDLQAGRLRAALAASFAQAAPSNAVIRRYRDGVSPSVRDMRAGWRSGRLDAVLRGNFDLIGAMQG
jgi:ATP-dependent Clp protease ATP-binding subunit ClpC